MCVPQQGPEGRWSRLGTWFWKAELGGKARHMKRPDLGLELGKHVPRRGLRPLLTGGSVGTCTGVPSKQRDRHSGKEREFWVHSRPECGARARGKGDSDQMLPPRLIVCTSQGLKASRREFVTGDDSETRPRGLLPDWSLGAQGLGLGISQTAQVIPTPAKACTEPSSPRTRWV